MLVLAVTLCASGLSWIVWNFSRSEIPDQLSFLYELQPNPIRSQEMGRRGTAILLPNGGERFEPGAYYRAVRFEFSVERPYKEVVGIIEKELTQPEWRYHRQEKPPRTFFSNYGRDHEAKPSVSVEANGPAECTVTVDLAAVTLSPMGAWLAKLGL